MANVMDTLRIFTNLSNKRDGVECKILINLSKWDFLAGGWKSKTSAGIKDTDMGVIVIKGMIECTGIDDITKGERETRKNREDHVYKFSVLNKNYF